MIYVPNENYQCYVVQNEEIIRAYQYVPTQNSTINYRDYYIHSDYIYKDGTQTFGAFTQLPVCLTNDSLTHDIYYRVDFDKILIIFIILSIISFYIPIKIFMRLFRRFN